jgi:hypothetical protein
VTTTTIKGEPDIYYETGMEGIGWIVGGGEHESLEFIDNGDYVIIKEKESEVVCYEGFVFFDPFIINLCRLGKYKVSFYPVNGFPEGLSPLEWEVFFKKNNLYTIEVIRGLLSDETLSTLLDMKRNVWKENYLKEKDLLFSSSVSIHAVKSDNFFSQDVGPRAGFELAKDVIEKGMGCINAKYLFFIIENERDIDFSKTNIIDSEYPFKESDFLIPQVSKELILEYSLLCFDFKKSGYANKDLLEKIKEMRPEFEHQFKKAVGDLPVHKKKTYSKQVLTRSHYLRCVQIPPEMSLLFI